MAEWTLGVKGLGRPLNINTVYGRMHHHARSDAVARWRKAGKELADSVRLPALGPVHVTATPVQANRRYLPDVGACLPSVKALIDGLCDAGVLAGDGPESVLSLTFQPVIIRDWDGLMLRLVTEENE